MIKKSTQTNPYWLKLHYFIALIITLHSLFFLVYGFAIGAYRQTIDTFLSGLLGLALPYVTIVMFITSVIFFGSLIRFWGLRLAVIKNEWHSAIPDWIFYVTWSLFVVGFYAAFYVIFQQDPSQKGVVRHLLNLTRLIGDALLFLLSAVWLRRLILYLRTKLQNSETRWPWTVGISFSLVALVGLWLLPALFPPNWAYQGDPPTKPALIAHRGASMLAPENTLAALDLAAVHQALGFETDLRISLDGVPYLMHDDTLARTTNIAEVFPERTQDRAESFMLEELKALNAGLWFLQKDPFGTIEGGLVSQTQLSINQGQHIPTLAETLERVDDLGMVILFDMRYPPSKHPYYADYFSIVLQQCIDARMNSNLWFLLAQEQLPIVMDRAPQMTRVMGVSSTGLPPVEAVLDQGYEIINVDTGIRTADIRAYRAEGLGVNIYTIDEPWLFSQFWLSGVTSVTTNNVHTFNQLDRPLLNVPYTRFMLFWGLYGIVLAIWLAGSQPEAEPVSPESVKSPNLFDLDLGPDVTIEVPKRIDILDRPQDDPGIWTSEPDEPGGWDKNQSEQDTH